MARVHPRVMGVFKVLSLENFLMRPFPAAHWPSCRIRAKINRLLRNPKANTNTTGPGWRQEERVTTKKKGLWERVREAIEKFEDLDPEDDHVPPP